MAAHRAALTMVRRLPHRSSAHPVPTSYPDALAQLKHEVVTGSRRPSPTC